MTTDQLLKMTPAKIAAEYRRAYADHFAGHECADYLRTLKAAFRVATEARKLGQ